MQKKKKKKKEKNRMLLGDGLDENFKKPCQVTDVSAQLLQIPLNVKPVVPDIVPRK